MKKHNDARRDFLKTAVGTAGLATLGESIIGRSAAAADLNIGLFM